MFIIKTKGGRLEISKEIVVVLLMDVFAIAYAVSARGISTASMMFPTFLLIGVALFSVMCIRQSIHYYSSEETSGEEAPGFGITKKLVMFGILTLATLVVFDLLGAVITIFLFLLSAMYILGIRSRLALLLIPLLVDIFVYLVFKVWLVVPLPAGLLPF